MLKEVRTCRGGWCWWGGLAIAIWLDDVTSHVWLGARETRGFGTNQAWKM